MEQKKRVCRKLSDQTKQRISAAQTGRVQSPVTRQRISQSMKDYWQKIPYEIGSVENNNTQINTPKDEEEGIF